MGESRVYHCRVLISSLLSLFLFTHASEAIDLALEPIQPIPVKLAYDVDKAALGEKLFFEPKLSVDNSISCAHCHDLDEKGGADGLKRSFGVDGRVGLANSPTVFNAALNFSQFWDGRAETLEDQVAGPVTAHAEMASTWPDVVKKLSADSYYRETFSQLYNNGVTAANIKHAIAEFERTLITPNSRFDRYLKGEADAITDEEKKGYRLFKEYGCMACHQGSNVGGNLFQVLGVMGSYYDDHPIENSSDLGRFNVTGKASDKHRFKVPSLRLTVLTAPYFHNGAYDSLYDAIRTMAKYQLGREIPDADVRSIISFLYTLPGEFRGRSLEPKEREHLIFPIKNRKDSR
ncbi:cytochrome-c peroxidase [Mariprofundus sp. KV]|uniref:cytochrome-c peroxidase n=1 Tax=Mariprofundus sp. KV TaxID=2608715 RepID=UPI0015A09BAE|nr:cytochrome-c peroxidase [Mariprofundus sp. KV]NWF36136.1 cytochrome-c peroxidase [Mariprofundus sp. KV]